MDNTRKRRLSRKEQKLKKKKRQCSLPGSSQEGEDRNKPTTLIDLGEPDASYTPTPIPSLDELKKENDSKPLGKWFPKAVVIKSSGVEPSKEAKAGLLLFYQYVEPPWTESIVQQLIGYLCKIGNSRLLGGRVRVAKEGVNATISSVDGEASCAATALRHFARDLRKFHTCFETTDFKFIDNLSTDRHFTNFKVFPVQELVFYGLSKSEAPLSKGGTHLDPKDFHKKLEEKKTVVVDVRNHYEAAIGRFDGQQEGTSAAEYVDPMMRKSTDFASWLDKPETKGKLEGKQVLLYCTGGVRCERASAFLNEKMGNKLNGVYQLQGGIERYFQSFPDGGHWRGKNFVFDKREAVGVHNHDGVGGVVRKEEHQDDVQTTCCVCTAPWDRYIGKKKCDTCGVPVLMCDSCMSSIKKKEPKPLIRCPLCIKENITVKASDVEYTDNGKVAVSEMRNSGKDKSAPTVLKWGGGHAAKKKDKRRFKNAPCRFGSDCNRPDCFFAHPPAPEKEKI